MELKQYAELVNTLIAAMIEEGNARRSVHKDEPHFEQCFEYYSKCLDERKEIFRKVNTETKKILHEN